MRVADTSALYALFSENDRHHGRALSDLKDSEPIVVPTEILVETIGLITLRYGARTAVNALRDLLRLRHVNVAEPVNFDAVRAVYDANAGHLSLADAFVVQCCRALGARPLTYDEAIRRAVA